MHSGFSPAIADNMQPQVADSGQGDAFRQGEAMLTHS
jgi:hypothetical protein